MKHLRIGILGTRGIPNRYGGFEQFAEKLAEGLVNQGHEVTVYNSSRHSYSYGDWKGINIVHCFEPGVWMGAAAQFVYDLNCILHARAAGFDVLLVLGYTSNSIWGCLYPQQTKVILNMDGWEWKRSKYSSMVQRFLLFSERLAVKRCQHLVADSIVIKEYVDKKYGISSTYIPYGADQDIAADDRVLSSFDLTKNEYYLLIARMVPENNIDRILEGLSGADQQRPVVVVSDFSTGYGKMIFSRFGHDKRFRFTGAIFEPAVLHNLRGNSRLYFHGHSVGGTNPSLLEAMAGNACICAHDNAFNRAILGEDACYFSDATDVAGICRLTRNEGLWETRRENNLVKVQQLYHWPRIIDQYAALFAFCCQPIHERKVLFIQDSIENKISYYHLLFFVASLPFDRLYSELALISLLLHQLFYLKQLRFRSHNWQYYVLPAIVYLLTLAGTGYTHYRSEAFYEWERQLALLLFPCLFGVMRLDLGRYKLSILKTMAFSCTVTIIYLYVIAIGTIVKMKLPLQALFNQAFINHNFSAPIEMHATYFSMYIALSFATMLYGAYTANTSGQKWWCVAILFVLGAGLLQLSSRSVLISMGILVNFLAPWLLFRKPFAVKFAAGSIIITIVLALLVMRIDGLKNRLFLQLKDDLTETGIRNNTLEPRIKRWKHARDLIWRSPIYGHGSGSEIALLKEEYYQAGLYNSYLNELNAHNQYLSIAIKTGMIGLLFFLFSVVWFFRAAIRSKDFLFACFLLIVCGVFFSENVLDANKGIFFFACFLSLFLFTNKNAVMSSTGR